MATATIDTASQNLGVKNDPLSGFIAVTNKAETNLTVKQMKLIFEALTEIPASDSKVNDGYSFFSVDMGKTESNISSFNVTPEYILEIDNITIGNRAYRVDIDGKDSFRESFFGSNSVEVLKER